MEHLGCVSILLNDNIPQSIVTLNTNLQAAVIKVKAHKTITLFSVYIPPRINFNYIVKICNVLPTNFNLFSFSWEMSMVTPHFVALRVSQY